MGMSPTGLLFFGMYLGEGYDVFTSHAESDEGIPDTDDLMMEAAGIAPIEGDFSERWAHRAKVLAGIPVTLEIAGYEYNQYIISIPNVGTSSSWEFVPVGDLTEKPEWAAQIREWVEKLGIDWDAAVKANGGPPRWTLGSWYS